MPPSRWSLTLVGSKFQDPFTLTHTQPSQDPPRPPKTPQGPPKKSPGQPTFTLVRYTITPSSYPFKSHSPRQTRDIPRQHVPIPPLSAIRARSCTTFRIGNQQAGNSGVVTREAHKVFLLHDISRKPPSHRLGTLTSP